MTVTPTPPIGAHLSVAGGLARCLPRARELGVEAIQVFVSNPRGWSCPLPDPEADAAFAAACPVPVFVHAPYLINFGSPDPQTAARSAASLQFTLRRGAAIGAAGVVLHAGSGVRPGRWEAAMAQTRAGLLGALDAVPEAPPLLVEPTAGGGAALACDAASLAAYLDRLGRDQRLGVCLDTCHLHAAGHDLGSEPGFAAALQACARAAGPNRIGLVHVNDSRDPSGSRRDRHAAIGAGTIGRDPFAALFTAPALRSVPLVVESAESEHATDIATLSALRGPGGRRGRPDAAVAGTGRPAGPAG